MSESRSETRDLRKLKLSQAGLNIRNSTRRQKNKFGTSARATPSALLRGGMCRAPRTAGSARRSFYRRSSNPLAVTGVKWRCQKERRATDKKKKTLAFTSSRGRYRQHGSFDGTRKQRTAVRTKARVPMSPMAPSVAAAVDRPKRRCCLDLQARGAVVAVEREVLLISGEGREE